MKKIINKIIESCSKCLYINSVWQSCCYDGEYHHDLKVNVLDNNEIDPHCPLPTHVSIFDRLPTGTDHPELVLPSDIIRDI